MNYFRKFYTFNLICLFCYYLFYKTIEHIYIENISLCSTANIANNIYILFKNLKILPIFVVLFFAEIIIQKIFYKIYKKPLNFNINSENKLYNIFLKFSLFIILILLLPLVTFLFLIAFNNIINIETIPYTFIFFNSLFILLFGIIIFYKKNNNLRSKIYSFIITMVSIIPISFFCILLNLKVSICRCLVIIFTIISTFIIFLRKKYKRFFKYWIIILSTISIYVFISICTKIIS